MEPNFNHSYWSIKRTILIWNSLFTIIITFPCIYCSHILCNEKLLYETCVEVFNFAFKFSEIYCELNCSKSRSPFLIGRWKRKKCFITFFCRGLGKAVVRMYDQVGIMMIKWEWEIFIACTWKRDFDCSIKKRKKM